MAIITLPNPGDPSWGPPLNTAINAVNADTETRALDSEVVHLTGAESVAGIKTFSDGVVVPAASIPVSAIDTLQTQLDSAGVVKTVLLKTPDPITGDVTFTLDDVPTGATNLPYTTDERATVEDRGNHTGLQVAATISDFAEAARDAVGAAIVAGSGVTVTVDDAGNTITITAPGTGSGYARATATYTTGTVAAAGREMGTVALGLGYDLYKIQVSGAARVRLYATAAQQTSDATRARGVDPTGDHGVMADFALMAGGSQTLAPVATCVNFDPGTAVAITVDNLESFSTVTTVTLTYLRKE